MSLIRKHGAVLQAWACLDLVRGAMSRIDLSIIFINRPSLTHLLVSLVWSRVQM